MKKKSACEPADFPAALVLAVNGKRRAYRESQHENRNDRNLPAPHSGNGHCVGSALEDNPKLADWPLDPCRPRLSYSHEPVRGIRVQPGGRCSGARAIRHLVCVWMDGGRRCEIVCSGRKLSRSRPNNLSRHCYRARWGVCWPSWCSVSTRGGERRACGCGLCPSHGFNTVGAGIDSRPRRSSQGALCCRNRSWDDRGLLVEPARVKSCGVVVGVAVNGSGRIVSVFDENQLGIYTSWRRDHEKVSSTALFRRRSGDRIDNRHVGDGVSA